jgi:hypothetical protein
MWSLFNRRPIEGIRKPLNNKPPFDLPSPHLPKLYRRRLTTKKTIQIFSEGNIPLNVAVRIAPQLDCKKLHKQTFPAGAIVPRAKRWIRTRAIRGGWELDQPVAQEHLNGCQERQIRCRRFRSSTHQSQVESVGQRKAFLYTLVTSVDQPRPSPEPSI